MRIALVNNYYYVRAGAERVLFDDQAGLEAAGCQVLPFAVQCPANSPSPFQSFFPPSFDFLAVRGWRRARVAADVVYSTTAGRAFAAFLDAGKPDVIHCHNIYGRLTTSILDAAKRRHIPVVLTAHDYKLICPSYLMLRQGSPCEKCTDGRYWRCLANRCHKNKLSWSLIYTAESYFNRLFGKYDSVARFLCPSRFLLDLLGRSGYPLSKLIFHPNAAPEGCLPTYPPGGYVLYAGRLAPGKGLETMVEAFRGSGIPLRIAGDGPVRPEFERQIEESPGNMTLLGHQSGDQLRKLIREAAFVVVPSEWFENAPMAVLEAFAHGKPVLAARIGGIPELVRDGENGLLFPAGDAQALAESAKRLWSDRALLERMGRYARETVETHYSQRRRIDQLLQIYREVGA